MEALIQAVQAGHVQGEIAAVISNNPDARGLETARSAGLATEAINHRMFESRESFDNALASCIEKHEPDLVILAGFMRILTPEFVKRFTGRLVNIHPSLLPKYPGLNTHQRAIDAGDKIAGVTVHFVTEELDGGPAIAQARVTVDDDETATSLATKVLEKEHRLYPFAVGLFCEGRLELKQGSAFLNDTPLPKSGLITEL